MEKETIINLGRMRSIPALLDFAGSTIDEENGVIKDVVMVQEGEAKGHDVHLQAEFISDLVKYDNRYYSKIGVKARLGHPGASSDSQGTQMGYFFNVRERMKGGKLQAIADLHLLESSNLSPTNPGMKDWVIGMSKEAPDFIMSSIVFKPGRYYQLDAKGKKVYVYEYKSVKDDDGGERQKWISPSDALGNVFVEFGKNGEHYYTDLVESGAATDSLFSNTANTKLFVARLGDWLDENPDIKTFILNEPAKVQEFLDRVGFKPQIPRKMNLMELLFGKGNPDEDTALSAAQVKELRDKMTELETKFSASEKRQEELQEQVTNLTSENEDLQTQLSAANNTIAELEKKPAAIHSDPKTEEDAPNEQQSWMKDPINQKAAKASGKRWGQG